jgi:hypothetical protein
MAFTIAMFEKGSKQGIFENLDLPLDYRRACQLTQGCRIGISQFKYQKG